MNTLDTSGYLVINSNNLRVYAERLKCWIIIKQLLYRATDFCDYEYEGEEEKEPILAIVNMKGCLDGKVVSINTIGKEVILSRLSGVPNTTQKTTEEEIS